MSDIVPVGSNESSGSNEPTSSPSSPSLTWWQRQKQSFSGGDDLREFTLNFDEINYGSYKSSRNTNETITYSHDHDRFKKIEDFEETLANKVRNYVKFHKIALPDKYASINSNEYRCFELAFLCLERYVISGSVNKEVVLSDAERKSIIADKKDSISIYHFWSWWDEKGARANVLDKEDKTNMDGKVKITFYFDFSKLKSLSPKSSTGGTLRRRRIVSRRFKKTRKHSGTRKNRRLYRK